MRKKTAMMWLQSEKMIRFGILTAATVIVPVMAGQAAALAQMDPDLQLRFNYLESEIKTINRKLDRTQSSAQTLQSNADLQAQIQEFEVQMRQLNGQIEEVSHSVRMLQKNLDKATEDNTLRFGDLEQKISALSSQVSAAKTYSSSAPAAGTSAASQELPAVQSILGAAQSEGGEGTQTAMLEEKPFMLSEGGGAAALAQYEQAFSLLKQGKYNSAQLNFETFLEKNPEHALASNAKYWLGETYYVRGDYAQAARIFAEGFQAYPRGAKAPDNLLKLGLTLESLDKKKDACIALMQVKKEFPAGASAVLSRAQKEIDRLGCQ